MIRENNVNKGTRKLYMLGMGLVALLAIGGMVLLGLPLDAVGELAWPAFLLTASALGANVGEHFAARKIGDT